MAKENPNKIRKHAPYRKSFLIPLWVLQLSSSLTLLILFAMSVGYDTYVPSSLLRFLPLSLSHATLTNPQHRRKWALPLLRLFLRMAASRYHPFPPEPLPHFLRHLCHHQVLHIHPLYQTLQDPEYCSRGAEWYLHNYVFGGGEFLSRPLVGDGIAG